MPDLSEQIRALEIKANSILLVPSSMPMNALLEFCETPHYELPPTPVMVVDNPSNVSLLTREQLLEVLRLIDNA